MNRAYRTAKDQTEVWACGPGGDFGQSSTVLGVPFAKLSVRLQPSRDARVTRDAMPKPVGNSSVRAGERNEQTHTPQWLKTLRDSLRYEP